MTQNERKHSRYQIGSTAAFLLNGKFYQGVVSNSSLGGLLLDLEHDVPSGLLAGNKLEVWLTDIFSELKHSYKVKVVRASQSSLALEFLEPFTESQKKFLDRWLNWQA